MFLKVCVAHRVSSFDLNFGINRHFHPLENFVRHDGLRSADAWASLLQLFAFEKPNPQLTFPSNYKKPSKFILSLTTCDTRFVNFASEPVTKVTISPHKCEVHSWLHGATKPKSKPKLPLTRKGCGLGIMLGLPFHRRYSYNNLTNK